MSPESQNDQIPPEDLFAPIKRPKNRRYMKLLGGAGVVMVLLIGALAAWQLSPEPQDPLGRIKLSNGKDIAVGQSIEPFKGDFRGSDGYYEYPKEEGLDNPLQVTVFTDKNKIVAIRVNRNQANIQTQTSIHTGMYLDEVPGKTGGAAEKFEERGKHGHLQGYRHKGSNTESLYLMNPCAKTPDKVAVYAVGLSKHMDKVKQLGAGCGNRGN